jgi:poly(A) polymerase
LLEHPRFRAGYDFFALRAASANAPQEAARWWEKFQDASPDERERMLVSDEAGPKKKRRRRRGGAKKNAPATGTEALLPDSRGAIEE